ncbi:MAG: hypothetical protein KKH98_11010 [Spirochaetes bacterium]|nr:hypothetical protein [Spirochaetota bacterium]
MRFLILIIGVFLSFHSFLYSEGEFKRSDFSYPVLTLNNETGERYAFLPLDDLSEDDFEIIDSYSFILGYYKLMQQITKTSKVNFKYSFNNKEYDQTQELNNNAGTFSFGLLYEILPKVTGDFNISYKEKNYIFESDKDYNTMSPGMEFKFKPIKEMLIGLKYVFLRTDYLNNAMNSKGNRLLVYWQERFLKSALYLRARYRLENRDYEETSSLRKNSTKHAFSLTAKIDFNK